MVRLTESTVDSAARDWFESAPAAAGGAGRQGHDRLRRTLPVRFEFSIYPIPTGVSSGLRIERGDARYAS